MPKFDQLSLAVQLSDFATFDNFYLASNAELVATVERCIADAGSQQEGQLNSFYIWGAEGSGRSHLLQAACHLANTLDKAAIYYPLEELVAYGPEALDGLEAMSVICLDNVDAVVGNSEWEQGLFHFYNKVREAGNLVIWSASAAPRQLNISLADLASRLSWGQVFQLQSLTEEEKLLALQMRSSRRGIELSQDVAQYILHRGARDMASLFSVLEQLDDASLKARRKLTIPFVKEVLGW